MTQQELMDQVPRIEHLGEIRALDFQRYAVAVGDLNPIYFDDQAARDAGYPGVVAPPNYLTSVMNWGAGPAEPELQADGTALENIPEELRGMRLMGGGNEIRFGQAVRAGDIVTATKRLVETRRRESKGGPLLIAIYETVYVNQDDAHLLTCRSTIIAAS